MLGLLSVSGLVLFAVGDTARATVDATVAAITEGDLVEGDASAGFDAELERTHPLRDVAIPVIAAARYIALRQGNPGVVVGREGWLFTREELQHHPEDEHLLRRRLIYVRHVADLLEHTYSAGLIVVVVPSKARVAAEYVPRHLSSAVSHARVSQATEALREEGITVLDAMGVLRPEDFFRRDTHWKPRGAARVAEAVSNTMDDLPDFGLPHRLRRLEPEVLEGDLLSFVPVGPWSEPLGLTPERYRPLEAASEGEVPAGGGLFDTPEIPIVLVGTSYSADPRFGFEAALRGALSGDILNVAEPAGGPFQPMATYLQGDTVSEISPELVVWEIPERYLTLPGVAAPTPAKSGALDD